MNVRDAKHTDLRMTVSILLWISLSDIAFIDNVAFFNNVIILCRIIYKRCRKTTQENISILLSGYHPRIAIAELKICGGRKN